MVRGRAVGVATARGSTAIPEGQAAGRDGRPAPNASALSWPKWRTPFHLGVNLFSFSVVATDRQRTDGVFALAARLAPQAKLLTLRLPGRR